MAFTDQQTRLLKAKLDAEHVKTREANGITLPYIEGWHAIAEANRIFGFDGWDRRTVATNCIWTGTRAQLYRAAYVAKVRIYVRAGDVLIVREGSGSGEGAGDTPGQAHELGLKSAETDATKRALATFGNPFGLALYDPEQANVRKVRSAKNEDAVGPWVLHSASGSEQASFAKPSEFAAALGKALTEAGDIETLFAIWEQNVDTLRALNRSLKQEHLPKTGIAPQLVTHLKRCAIALVKPSQRSQDDASVSRPLNTPIKLDKSALTIGHPKRIRCKEHLRFVASQPCLVCGRAPSHAHHVRYAQSRGLGLKVSDEFTVPLCAIHHRHVHSMGKEREWWQARNIDPLKVAGALWQKSRNLSARAPRPSESMAVPAEPVQPESLAPLASDHAEIRGKE